MKVGMAFRPRRPFRPLRSCRLFRPFSPVSFFFFFFFFFFFYFVSPTSSSLVHCVGGVWEVCGGGWCGGGEVVVVVWRCGEEVKRRCGGVECGGGQRPSLVLTDFGRKFPIWL